MLGLKSVVAWLFFILAESLNGTVRVLWLEPAVGEAQALPISFAMGTILVMALATLSTPWLLASRSQQLGVGALWSGLTFAFELGLGRLIFGYSWPQILADYQLSQGGLMPIGLLLIMISPCIGQPLWGWLIHGFQRIQP